MVYMFKGETARFGVGCLLHCSVAVMTVFLRKACAAVSTSMNKTRTELAACGENISWSVLLGAIYFDTVL
jgi:hypothetical protein